MKRKNIMITGWAGFIGSHIVDCFLRDKYYNIIGVDKLTYAANVKNLEDALNNKNLKFINNVIN